VERLILLSKRDSKDTCNVQRLFSESFTALYNESSTHETVVSKKATRKTKKIKVDYLSKGKQTFWGT